MKGVIILLSALTIPLSIFSMVTSINNQRTINQMKEVIDRQYEINASHYTGKKERLPYSRRLIKINGVSFNEKGTAVIKFKDTNVNTTYTQVGCPSFAVKIGSSFYVDLNTKNGVYEISCKHVNIGK